MGAIMRQGPHQGAQQSRRTGLSARRTAVGKVASVTMRGLADAAPAAAMGSFCPHLPQTGWRDWARSSMRFFVPQLGQVMTGMGAPVTPQFRARTRAVGMENRCDSGVNHPNMLFGLPD